jgi:hypothetical protein
VRSSSFANGYCGIRSKIGVYISKEREVIIRVNNMETISDQFPRTKPKQTCFYEKPREQVWSATKEQI